MSQGETKENVIPPVAHTDGRREEQVTAASHNCLAQGECDGQDFKQLIGAGMSWLERHKAAINSLNVFPVPDGDTGTNMYLTLQAAWQEIAAKREDTVSSIAHAVAHGALMGARGNSGVILSQLFRGMAQALDGHRTMGPRVFAQALQQASATAYKAVIRPVEGTILTVARKAADAGAQAAETEPSFFNLLARVVAAAGDAVADTPSELPVLAEAGVVDAGGQGFFVILEGMLRCLRGEELAGSPLTEEAMEMIQPMELEEGYGYDVQFILHGKNLDVDNIRSKIDAMGDSTLVVGGSTTVKVHVHTPNPGDPLNYAASIGSLSRIIVENMQEQYQEFVKSHTPAPPQPKTAPPSGIAVIAVVPGDGLAKVYLSLGSRAIVPGGQTMNPSTEDLLKAIAEVESEEVIILPNNKNVVLTAEQASKMAKSKVRVVPSKTIPQGIGALLAFNYQGDLETNVSAMEEALSSVRTGEITRAVRSVKIDGIKVKKGQIIGLLDGQLTAAGDKYDEVLLKLLEEVDAGEMEIITLYFGEDSSREEAEAMGTLISSQYPEQEVEIVEGGQPHYPFILSVE